MSPKFQRLQACTLVLLLAACGGGGSSGGATSGVPSPVDAEASGLMITPGGTRCDGVSTADATGGLVFETTHPIGAQAYGCLVVDQADGQPVAEGAKSLRFELRPADCSSNSGFDDCKNDRSRHEINEDSRPGTQGSILTYETRVFVPPQTRLRPRGGNALVVTQINFTDGNLYGTLAYLEIGTNGELQVRTHVGFTYDILNQVTVLADPVGRWVNVRYEIKSTSAADGYIKVFVDGVLKVDEVRATLPTASAAHTLKIGLYNAFKTRASEPYKTQVIHFDALAKSRQ